MGLFNSEKISRNEIRPLDGLNKILEDNFPEFQKTTPEEYEAYIMGVKLNLGYQVENNLILIDRNLNMGNVSYSNKHFKFEIFGSEFINKINEINMENF